MKAVTLFLENFNTLYVIQALDYRIKTYIQTIYEMLLDCYCIEMETS